ncbi:MAG TPA: hypothetical protein DCX95_03215 [Elusimicrobia bacterium]|nr:hypothetical protein [Elusimicrobiota bacterium]
MKKWFLVFVVGLGLRTAHLFSSENNLTTIKPTGFARARYTVDTTAGAKDGFTIAQARLGLKGDISKDVAFSFSFEGTNADTINNKAVCDAYIDIKSIPYFSARVGQFKYKFSLENVTPDQELELITKSAVANNLINPTRDIGAEVSKNFLIKSVKADYSVAVINGSGSNQADENDYKSIVVRAIFTPLKDFHIGGSVYDGKTGAEAVAKDRTGLEAKYEFDKLLCKAEYIFGKDDTIKKEGYYATVGYTVKPSVMALARYDVWDSSLKTGGEKNRRWTLGLNYFLDKNVLFRNNYERKMETPSIKNDLIMSELQVKF